MGAFAGTPIATVTLPEEIYSIDRNVFDAQSLTDIYMTGREPFVINIDDNNNCTFGDIDQLSHITLHIPQGSKFNYTKKHWDIFSNIDDGSQTHNDAIVEVDGMRFYLDERVLFLYKHP